MSERHVALLLDDGRVCRVRYCEETSTAATTSKEKRCVAMSCLSSYIDKSQSGLQTLSPVHTTRLAESLGTRLDKSLRSYPCKGCLGVG